MMPNGGLWPANLIVQLATTWPNIASWLTRQEVATEYILPLIRSVIAPRGEKTHDHQLRSRTRKLKGAV